MTEYRFTSNSPPLRTTVAGKGCEYRCVLEDSLSRKAQQQPVC